jgi:hypothetical protein
MAQSTRDVPSKPHLFWLRSWLHQRPDFGRRECFIEFLFKENLSAEGKFRALGEMLSLESVKCPIYLLAGESDDITTKEQVFAAEGLVGTSAEKIEKRLVPGGTSAFSWERARSRKPGPRSPGGSLRPAARDAR